MLDDQVIIESVFVNMGYVPLKTLVLDKIMKTHNSGRTPSLSSCDQTATLCGVTQDTVSKVMTTYTLHGKTGSAKNKIGRS